MALKQKKASQIGTNEFMVEFRDFNQGFSPLAHLNSLTEQGNQGHASSMLNADILDGLLTQGPALANLTAGTQVGAVTELINFILETPPANDLTYGIGPTKLFKISSTAVTNDGIFPHTITNCTDGSSIIQLLGKIYYFFNKAAGGEIGRLVPPNTFIDNWGSTTPVVGAAAIQKAPHSVAGKEDLMLFGNGQYAGLYIVDNDELNVSRLDFGTNCEVADVIFYGNYWYLAVNSGITGTNRSVGEIYLYDGAALDGVLADETGVGMEKIGFLYILDGTIYVAYQDLSSTGGYNIGYIVGRQIKYLCSFTGSLPTFAQKTLFRHTILFLAGAGIWSFGAVVSDFPIQISQIADGGYATLGALASPFGTPMVASTDGATNFRLAKFSGYDINSNWKTIIIPTTAGRVKGYIDTITVLTNALVGSAAATLTVECNQNTLTSNSKVIATAGKIRHIFDVFGLGEISDFRVAINFSNGNSTNPCKIRSILVKGHWVECS